MATARLRASEAAVLAMLEPGRRERLPPEMAPGVFSRLVAAEVPTWELDALSPLTMRSTWPLRLSAVFSTGKRVILAGRQSRKNVTSCDTGCVRASRCWMRWQSSSSCILSWSFSA